MREIQIKQNKPYLQLSYFHRGVIFIVYGYFKTFLIFIVNVEKTENTWLRLKTKKSFIIKPSVGVIRLFFLCH